MADSLINPINPFQTLFMTEKLAPTDFVDVFSPMIIAETYAVYDAANIIVSGRQGCGKSMLLNLLKPEVRIAYHESPRAFPLADEFRHFLGCGTNLIRSGALDFGQREMPSSISEPDHADVSEVTLYFGDFLNYLIVRDMLRSLIFATQKDSPLRAELGLTPNKKELDALAREIAREDCWEGHLDGSVDMNRLLGRLDERLRAYRHYLHFNAAGLPVEVVETKTAVGEPIAATADAISRLSSLHRRLNIFVRIDQFESLVDIERSLAERRGTLPQPEFQAAVHKLLALRDPRVHYKIGTRRWAWAPKRIFGSGNSLEEYRDYLLIDIDNLLSDTEHNKGRFAKFADDVFERRLRLAGYDVSDGRATVRRVFGRSPYSRDLAMEYVRNNRALAVRIPTKWTKAVRRVLEALAETDPLAARLGSAWLRQQFPPPTSAKYVDAADPGRWMGPQRQYWRKDRTHIALFQLASENRQRLRWYGDKDLLQLCDNNILVFVSICQKIWLAWLREQQEYASEEGGTTLRSLPEIEPLLQDDGIHEASTAWFRKLADAWEGDSYQSFVRGLAERVRAFLKRDDAYSNPGYTGMSIGEEDLRIETDIADFLEDACSWGALVRTEHLSKTKGQASRFGYYVFPVLCPHLQIVSKHVKHGTYEGDMRALRSAIKTAREGRVPRFDGLNRGSQLALKLEVL